MDRYDKQQIVCNNEFYILCELPKKNLVCWTDLLPVHFRRNVLILIFQNSCLGDVHTGPGLEAYLKGFNFTGEPPWLSDIC